MRRRRDPLRRQILGTYRPPPTQTHKGEHMGVDALIYATGDLTLNEDSPWFDTRIHTGTGAQPERVYHETDERYFSKDCPRGHWPTLYAEIRQLGSVFPKATVYYSSDHHDRDDPGDECTAAFLEGLWQAYLAGGQG